MRHTASHLVLLVLIVSCAGGVRSPFEALSPSQLGPPGTRRIGIEQRVLCEDSISCFQGPHSPADLSTLARRLRGTPISLDSVYHCQGFDPSTCRLSGVDQVVALGHPRIQRDTARVTLESWTSSSSSRQPVVRARMQVVMERRRGTWRVVRFDEDGTS